MESGETIAKRGIFSMHRKSKIGLLLVQPTPYRDPFIKKLSLRDDMDIKALFLGKVCGTWDWKREPECDFPHLFVELPAFFDTENFTKWLHPSLPRVLREEQLDLLVINGYFMPSQIWAALWCIWSGVPYIFWSESHDRGFRTSWYRKLFRHLFIDPLFRRASAHIAVSTYARERIMATGVPGDSVSIILNSPDVEKYIEETDALRKDRDKIRDNLGLGPSPVLLFVGRMVPEKGLEELLEAYIAIIEKNSIPGLQLLLVGEGPLLESLKKRCAERNLNNVRFAGFVAPEKLYPYYVAADAFVLPSRYETFGAVVHEAAAAGLPLVVSDCCGAVAELLRDGENGVAFRACDAGDLAKALERLYSLVNEWDKMGEKSRALAKKYGYSHGEEQFVKAVRFALDKR